MLFLCGKRNYKTLASSACIVKNTRENCSFGCIGSREHTLRRQPGLVGKAFLWVRKLMLHFSLSSLFVVTLRRSHFTVLYLFPGFYTEGNRSATNSGIFCHMSMIIFALPHASASESKLFSTFCGFGGRARLENMACVHP